MQFCNKYYLLIRNDKAPDVSFTMLNHTHIEEKLRNVSFIEGATPRWYFMGKLRNPNNNLLNTSVTILILNTSKELEIGLGREYPQRQLRGNVNSLINLQ